MKRPFLCVVVDSREAIPGSVFVALPGEKVDGHDYVPQAFANGAIAALVEREQPNFPTIDLRRDQPLPEIRSVSPPICLLVDDTVAAMQDVAQAWRSQFDTKVDRHHRQRGQNLYQRTNLFCPLAAVPHLKITRKS